MHWLTIRTAYLLAEGLFRLRRAGSEGFFGDLMIE